MFTMPLDTSLENKDGRLVTLYATLALFDVRLFMSSSIVYRDINCHLVKCREHFNVQAAEINMWEF